MATLPNDYYLTANPFDPQTGDRRDLDRTPLVGAAKRVLELLVRAVESKNVVLAVIYGEWGHGKTTMFRKAMKELARRYNNRVFTARYRIPRGETISFRKAIAMALKMYKECLAKSINICESLDELNIQIDTEDIEEISVSSFVSGIEDIINNAIRMQKSYIMLGLDQLETTRIDDNDIKELVMRMRDLVDKYSKHIGFALVFLATPQWLPRSKFDDKAYRRLMGSSLVVEEIERLTLEEVKELFRKILSYYRNPNAPQNISEYHPFTEEAINEIYKLSNGVPRQIYEIASRLLNEGLPPPIDVDQVLLYSGVIKRQWYEALSMPIIDLRTLVHTALTIASRLSREQVLPGRIIVIPTNIIDINSIQNIIDAREGIEATAQQRLNELRKAIDIITYIQQAENINVYLIKVTNKRINKRHLTNAIEFIKKYVVKFQGKAIPLDAVTLLFISRRIARTLKDQVDLIEVQLPYPISIKYVEVAENDEDKPEKYGVLRWIYEEFRRCGEDNISCLEGIKDDVKYVIRSILQARIEE